MSITVKWANPEETTIHIVFRGHWELPEFHTAAQQAFEMIDSVSKQVDIIVDIQQGNRLPGDFISALRRVSFRKHANFRMLVLVGANTFVRAIANAVRKVWRRQARFAMADTLDEAYAILAQSSPVAGEQA